MVLPVTYADFLSATQISDLCFTKRASIVSVVSLLSSRLRMFVGNERSILLIFGYKDIHDGCIAETSLPISLITLKEFPVNSTADYVHVF